MDMNTWLPALIVMSSLVPGVAIFLLREENWGETRDHSRGCLMARATLRSAFVRVCLDLMFEAVPCSCWR